MTPQELRTERRRRAYGGTPQRERNGPPSPSERLEQIRIASDIDEAIAAEHPELARNAQALALRRRQLELLRLTAG